MAISLNKGGKLSLSKEAPDLKKVLVGLGWDARATDGADFDLDASAFLLGADYRPAVAEAGKIKKHQQQLQLVFH
jgi:stress response protein SCP2